MTPKPHSNSQPIYNTQYFSTLLYAVRHVFQKSSTIQLDTFLLDHAIQTQQKFKDLIKFIAQSENYDFPILSISDTFDTYQSSAEGEKHKTYKG